MAVAAKKERTTVVTWGSMLNDGICIYTADGQIGVMNEVSEEVVRNGRCSESKRAHRASYIPIGFVYDVLLCPFPQVILHGLSRQEPLRISPTAMVVRFGVHIDEALALSYNVSREDCYADITWFCEAALMESFWPPVTDDQDGTMNSHPAHASVVTGTTTHVDDE